MDQDIEILNIDGIYYAEK